MCLGVSGKNPGQRERLSLQQSHEWCGLLRGQEQGGSGVHWEEQG